jgi:Tol biopolymer transport system component
MAQLYIRPADGSDEQHLIADQPGIPTNWSKDGRWLTFINYSPKTLVDLWVMTDPAQPSPHELRPILVTSLNEGEAQISPDGRWISYTTDDAAQAHLYVRPFRSGETNSGTGPKWQISDRGARFPRWSSDGKRLFYCSAPAMDLMAVDIDTGAGFHASNPRRLFSPRSALLNVGWDVAPDGKYPLFITANAGRALPFTVAVNWQAGLPKKSF